MIKINLLREELEPQKKPAVEVSQQRRNLLFVLLVVGAVAFLGYRWFTLNSRLNEMNRRINLAQREKANLATIIEEVHRYDQRRKELERKLNLILQLQKNRTGPVELLKEVAYLLPPQLWFTSLIQRGNAVTIEGDAISYNAIADFLKNLDSSPYVAKGSVDLLEAVEAAGGIKRFSLTFVFTIPKSSQASSVAE
ncbi:MAG: PilN domain-containing protein [Acidobacteria bacterium]|nr:PilN domain-containing protein [Acidobacteriota bacterium]